MIIAIGILIILSTLCGCIAYHINGVEAYNVFLAIAASVLFAAGAILLTLVKVIFL